MLVLSRRINEKLVLPDVNATLQIVAIKPGLVRIGFDGPDNLAIFREEIFDAEKWQTDRRERDDDRDVMLGRLLNRILNRLASANIGLVVLQRQLQQAQSEAPVAMLEKIENEIAQAHESIRETTEALFPPSAADSQQKRARALLVEEDRNECELLAGLLRLAGVEVATAGDGADALDYLRDNSGSCPDYVFMNVGMQRSDGLTAAQAIRNNPDYENVKIFAVSGRELEPAEVSSAMAIVDGWFQKPLNPEILLRVLR